MTVCKFTLTDEQVKIVTPLLEKTEADCFEDLKDEDLSAAVFQIFRFDGKGDVYAVGDYVSNEKAKKIQEILNATD